MRNFFLFGLLAASLSVCADQINNQAVAASSDDADQVGTTMTLNGATIGAFFYGDEDDVRA